MGVPDDYSGFTTSKKSSKKDKKKKRQSTFDDFEAQAEQQANTPLPTDEGERTSFEPTKQSITDEDRSTDDRETKNRDIGLAAGAVAAGIGAAALAASASGEAEPSSKEEEDEWGFTSSKKASKKDKKKKNRQAEFYEPEAESSRDLPADAVGFAPPGDEGAVPLEPEPQPIELVEPMAEETKPDDDWGFTTSKKSSKKDKKKNRQAEVYEPIDEPAREQPSELVAPVDDVTSTDAREPTVGETKPDDDWGFTPSRKASKKDKKKNRQAELYEPAAEESRDQVNEPVTLPEDSIRDLDVKMDPATTETNADELKPEGDWGFEPSRKPSKKDKKNRKAEAYGPTSEDAWDQTPEAIAPPVEDMSEDDVRMRDLPMTNDD